MQLLATVVLLIQSRSWTNESREQSSGGSETLVVSQTSYIDPQTTGELFSEQGNSCVLLLGLQMNVTALEKW